MADNLSPWRSEIAGATDESGFAFPVPRDLSPVPYVFRFDDLSKQPITPMSHTDHLVACLPLEVPNVVLGAAMTFLETACSSRIAVNRVRN